MVHDDPDVRALLDWMKANGRLQDWRALDRNGKPRRYKRKMVELSRSKIRIVLNLPPDRIDAAFKTLVAENLAMPVGRMLPMETCQAVELWVVLA